MKKDYFVTYLYSFEGVHRSGSGVFSLDVPPCATPGQIAWSLNKKIPYYTDVAIINFWEM